MPDGPGRESRPPRRPVNRIPIPRPNAGHQPDVPDIDDDLPETILTMYPGDVYIDDVIEELANILQDRDFSEEDVAHIIEEIFEALANYEEDIIELDTFTEKITQILLDYGLSEDEIYDFIREFIEVLEILIIEDDVLINEKIIRAPVSHTTVYRTDNGGINWEVTNMDTTTFMAEDGTVMISIRFITYAWGADVHWNSITSTATLSTDDLTIQLTVGSAAMFVNGQIRPLLNNQGMLSPAYLRAEHSRMFIPMSSVGEAFNVEYRFDDITREAVFYLSRPLN